uniref:Uncharacterized protein n=1 Tax=Solanum lycopersicum TaxID=4081 RepID=A0A3Q7HBG5_SOLLC
MMKHTTFKSFLEKFSYPKPSLSFMNTSLLTTENLKNFKNEKSYVLILKKKLSAIEGLRFDFHLFYSSVKSRGSKFNLIKLPWNGQPSSVFYVYYCRFTSYSHYFKNCNSTDNIIELPGMQPLSPIDFLCLVFDDSEENSRVLVNTFDALEFDALRIIKHVIMVGIGPLMP